MAAGEGAATTVELTGTNARRLPIVAVLAANIISLSGSALTNVAVPWFVLVTTGSAMRTGITAAVALLPVLLGGVLGGALVDRAGFKRSSVWSDLLSAVAVAAIPLLYHTVGLGFGELLLILFVGKLLNTPGGTARMSLVPELAELANMSLARANSALSVAYNVSALGGAALAGVLIAVLGASNVLLVDATTFLISAVLIGLLVPAKATGSAAGGPATYLMDLREGLDYLRGDRLTLVMSGIFAVVNFLIAPLIAVVLPVYVRRVYGSAVELGLLLGAAGVGTLMGVLAYGAFGSRLPRRATFVGAFLVAAVPLMGLALLPGLVVAVVVVMITGLAAGPIDPLAQTIMQERVPPALLGRVFGLVSAVSTAASPLGMLIAGVMLQLVSLRATILMETGLFLAVAVSLVAVPSLRELG